MRHVATVIVGIALTGCSLIYSPNNLPTIDAPPADADPSMLSVDGAGPAVLLEGQGVGGARPAILAITGKNFVASATVRVFATGSQAPMITVNDSDPLITPRVSAASDVLAVSVTLPIDLNLPAIKTAASEDIPLTIEVSQPSGAETITRTLTGAVTLRTLPELTAAIADSAQLQPLYSQVELSGPLTFTPASGRPRALIRSASTIRLKDVNVSASVTPGGPPGPGGAAGGAIGKPGDGGSSGGRAGTATAGGGGGGCATAGSPGGGGTVAGGLASGDPLVSSYDSNACGGGGGGGGVTGGAGGSSGGTLELTAAGDLQVGAITANGGAGVGGTPPGGGGAGGIIMIRAGGTAMLGGAITASAGVAGTGVGTGGNGSVGRVRVDAPKITGAQAADPPPISNPPYHVGASFDPKTPLVFTAQAQKAGIKLLGSVADKFDLVVLDSAGGTSSPAFTADFGNATMITVRPTLQPGFNRVCVTKNGGSVTVVEATNCIDVAYLP